MHRGTPRRQSRTPDTSTFRVMNRSRRSETARRIPRWAIVRARTIRVAIRAIVPRRWARCTTTSPTKTRLTSVWMAIRTCRRSSVPSAPAAEHRRPRWTAQREGERRAVQRSVGLSSDASACGSSGALACGSSGASACGSSGASGLRLERCVKHPAAAGVSRVRLAEGVATGDAGPPCLSGLEPPRPESGRRSTCAATYPFTYTDK